LSTPESRNVRVSPGTHEEHQETPPRTAEADFLDDVERAACVIRRQLAG
jgi:hypothetical protein